MAIDQLTTKHHLAANLSLLFTEHPFLERFEAAAESGFRAVEFQFPYDFNIREIKSRLDRTGQELVLHNFPAGDHDKGERGLAIQPDGVDRFRASVDLALATAIELGCPRLNCLAGVRPDGFTDKSITDTYIANLCYAAEKLATADITLLIEPINTVDVPGFYLNRMSQALGIIDAVDMPNVAIQFDVYHMHIMGEDICGLLTAFHDKIRHVQIADHPGRHEPGTGEIDFPVIFSCLDAIGYHGWIGCEYVPVTTTNDGLDWRSSIG